MKLSILSDEKIFEIAQPIWDKMSEGSNKVDFELFSGHFSIELKNKIGKERFQSQCKEFPLLTSLGRATPVSCIRRKEGVTIIYRQLSTQLEGEFIGQLTLSGSSHEHRVINAQVY